MHCLNHFWRERIPAACRRLGLSRRLSLPAKVCRLLLLLSGFGLLPSLHAVTLTDFGYQHMNINGQLATNTRPLLVIVANFAGEATNYYPPPAPLTNTAYYNNLVFNTTNYPSLNGYYSAVSNGRFAWTPAGTVYLNLPASAQDGTWPGPGGDPGHDQPYMSNIVYQAMLQTNQFNFKVYDKGDHHITLDELGILIIGNDFTKCGDTGGPVTSPDGSYSWGQVTNLLNTCKIGTLKVTDTPFITWCEEFEESLGCGDIYGQKAWSWSLTPQSNEPPLGNYWYLYYLDPWQRMSLGWCEPRIVSMPTGGLVTIPAAQAGDPTAPVILYDPAHGTSEFWILEYRTQTSPDGPGYDANVVYANGSNPNGLAVWHIQQDGNHNLLTTGSNSITGGAQQTEWNEGPPNLVWGANNLWGSDSITPALTWWNGDYNGTSTNSSATHLHVRPFSQGDGSITVEILTAGDVWVDFNYTGSPQNGTFANPYNTLAAAVAAASYGATIHVKSGASFETPTVTKLVTFVGYNGTAAIGH
jgi:M6 family metalloprotease-like protein